MNSLLSARDKKNLPSKICKETIHLTFYDACKCYNYWKERLSEIEKKLLECKKMRTILYRDVLKKPIAFDSYYSRLQLKKDILYLRLLKQEASQIYKEAKKQYLEIQKKIETETPSWKNIQGKFLHKITITNKSSKEVHITNFVKLDEEYHNFSDFVDSYNIQQTLEDEKDIRKYNFLAFYTFKTLMQFYNSEDFKISIEPTNETPKDLFDVIQFKAFQQGGLPNSRITYDEFKEKIEHKYEKTLVGFKEWFIVNYKNTLKKRFPGKKACDIVTSEDFKKTYKNWKRYFDMWQNGETPEIRRAKKN